MAYGRSNTISRQFSDSELALDDRLDAFLAAPAVNTQMGTNLGQTYGLLRQQLEGRSLFAKQLQDEQEMAYQQSARHELARKAQQEDDDTLQAKDAFSKLTGLTKEGQSVKGAFTQLVQDDPSLILNKKFAEQAQGLGGLMSSPEEEELERTKQFVTKLKLGTEAAKLESEKWLNDALSTPEMKRKQVDAAIAKLDSEVLGAANERLKTDLLDLRGQIDFQATQRDFTEFSSALKGAQEGNNLANAWVNGRMAQLGLGIVPNAAATLKALPEPVQRMFANQPALDEIKAANPELFAEVGRSLEVLGSTPEGDDPERNRAKATLNAVAGMAYVREKRYLDDYQAKQSAAAFEQQKARVDLAVDLKKLDGKEIKDPDLVEAINDVSSGNAKDSFDPIKSYSGVVDYLTKQAARHGSDVNGDYKTRADAALKAYQDTQDKGGKDGNSQLQLLSDLKAIVMDASAARYGAMKEAPKPVETNSGQTTTPEGQKKFGIRPR